MTDGAATVSTCVCVTMVEYVTAYQEHVCVPLATLVPPAKTDVQMEPSEVVANTPVCVSKVPAVSTTQGHVCVLQAILARIASEVRVKV